MAAETRTGAKDETYDLVSLLYHTLQEADTLTAYLSDTREAGDEELARFIQETLDQDRERAEKAKKLLAGRLSRSGA
ncbi:acyl carrier protein [Streptomyces atacamensis]|uniref:acyl carrier protein n=1 Tax=Streptomyces atacamensis TaxID=531966 RepID=UPI00399CB05A